MKLNKQFFFSWRSTNINAQVSNSLQNKSKINQM